MHELGIANAMLEAVRAEARQHPSARVRGIGVLLGELAGVDRDALSFCYDALVVDTELADATLQIEFSPRRHRCGSCDATFTVVDYGTNCLACGSRDTACISGEELALTYIELEEI